MINGCGNCANYVWGDNKTPLPSDCITCITTHVPNGQHPTPSHWKALPQTNADRIRTMSDEELAEVVAKGVGCVLKAPHCMDCDCTPCILKWLKQPAEGEDNAED